MNNGKEILIWEFYEAPRELQALSDHGGDEDGVVLVPSGVELPWWIERLWNQYGDPQKIDRDDGSTVYIWAHA